MSEVKLQNPHDLEKCLKILKKKMDREGTIKEARERMTFKKKSRTNYEKKRKQAYQARLESKNRY